MDCGGVGNIPNSRNNPGRYVCKESKDDAGLVNSTKA